MLNFIEEIITHDLETGKHKTIITRFPPEPNGYLHIGHAKSICLNFGLGIEFMGKTNLRFDDTNPTKEDIEYVDSIKEDVKWLGFEWAEERYASDYFQEIYDLTVKLIKKGLAYVDPSTAEEIAASKGTPTQAGTDSPYRTRSVEENLRLFLEMKDGKHAEGSMTLRAKIDMASPNMQMRDPLLYRIKFATHHQTGDKWCIYPMYDYAHPISDAIENITHSLCTLEFEVHRPLYEWTIANLDLFPSRQIEFARLNLTYTVMSKRKLLQLVQNKLVEGWDDPRMPTISGLRRRGYTPSALREFATRIGIAKRENLIDVELLEFCLREDLNKTSQRLMAVLNPLKVIIENYPEKELRKARIENNPENESKTYRWVRFLREIYIEQEDFMENPVKGFHRLVPGGYVRLKSAYIIQHKETIYNADGTIKEIRCNYIKESRSGNDKSGLKVKGLSHWVSVELAIEAQCNLYDKLFTEKEPDSVKDKSFTELLNPDSLKILPKIFIEASIKTKKLKPGTTFQFLRHGYFCVDKNSTNEHTVFNRTVTLKDLWKPSVS